MIEIPIKPIPNQKIDIILNKQNVRIIINYKYGNLYADVYSKGDALCYGAIIRNNTPIIKARYTGFDGNLFMHDMNSTLDPDYELLGKRYRLVYLTNEEVKKFNVVV